MKDYDSPMLFFGLVLSREHLQLTGKDHYVLGIERYQTNVSNGGHIP